MKTRSSMRRLRHRRTWLAGRGAASTYRRTSRFTGPGTGMPVSIPVQVADSTST
jgi:hypothetical protein